MPNKINDVTEIKKNLIKWYSAIARDLPWRKTKNPYFILISEIMLQQTIVKVVIPYFKNFIHAFPTVESLAKAKKEDVLNHWSGLGYYSRAKNLQDAAKKIVELGRFPDKYENLLMLPGVGPYTAAAVASIAFNEEVAAIDGNVVRVITRLFDIKEEVSTKDAKSKIANFATVLISGQDPSTHNQAMMELGATICLPKNPACMLCPLNKDCLSFKNGTQLMRPVKLEKRRQEPWLWTLFAVYKNGKIGVVKDLNGTPWLKNTFVLPGAARPWIEKGKPPYDFKHSITHHNIYVKVQDIKLKELDSKFKLKWISLEKKQNIGVSSVVHKTLKFLQTKKSSGIKTFLFAALALSTLAGCASKGTLKDEQSVPILLHTNSQITNPKAGQILQLTTQGENTMAVFSPDGTKILFQSRGRSENSNPQIYFLDLSSGKERRLTFNDGEDANPSFSPDGNQILYSSTTDELKESLGDENSNSAITANAPVNPFPNYEIYKANTNGENRIRLTHNKGYDAEGVFFRDGKKIIFVSRRSKGSDLFLMDSSGKNARPFLKSKNNISLINRGNPAVSPDGKFVTWSERQVDGSAQIMLSNINGGNIKQLTFQPGFHVNPSFTSDGKALVYSSNSEDPAHFNIFYMHLESSCLVRLTKSQAIDLFPQVSPDRKTLIFSSNRNGKFQLYQSLMSYPLDCFSGKP
jgi:A/G-specific adenine glycosylase